LFVVSDFQEVRAFFAAVAAGFGGAEGGDFRFLRLSGL
jgi:hypothetical protein